MIQLDGHQVRLLRDGAETFPAMLSAIQHAQFTLCMQTYILRDDLTGQRFADALSEKAREGVDVNLMFDAWGSSVSEGFLNRLREAGVRVQPFGKVRFAGRIRRMLHLLRRRNHRKILLVDGQVGFVGGLNVSNEYAATSEGGKGWRDTHVEIRGPAVAILHNTFLDMWKEATGQALSEARYRRRVPPLHSRVQFVSNDFGVTNRHIHAAYVNAFASAQNRLFLTHAYFVPPLRLLRALAKAARRGVDVRIIIAAHTDVPIVHLASRSLYGRLLRAGVRIFEWKGDTILHAKTAVADGYWSTVGSANLDALSLHSNLETNAVIEDGHFSSQLEQLFHEDLAQCEEVTWAAWQRRSWAEQTLSHIAYQLRHWL